MSASTAEIIADLKDRFPKGSTVVLKDTEWVERYILAKPGAQALVMGHRVVFGCAVLDVKWDRSSGLAHDSADGAFQAKHFDLLAKPANPAIGSPFKALPLSAHVPPPGPIHVPLPAHAFRDAPAYFPPEATILTLHINEVPVAPTHVEAAKDRIEAARERLAAKLKDLKARAAAASTDPRPIHEQIADAIGSRVMAEQILAPGKLTGEELRTKLKTKPPALSDFDKWRRWDLANPAFYDHFRKLALQAQARGVKEISGWLIANVIRWQTEIETKGADWKVPNGCIAYFTRLFQAEFPQHALLFETRPLKTPIDAAALEAHLYARAGL